MLSEFLFLEDDATKDEKSNYLALKVELRQMLNDDFNRRILTQVLLDLRKDISGSTQDLICKLYQSLGLEDDAYQKLKSWRWQSVCEGIVELSQMKVSDAYSFICRLIKDRRSIIRKQAEIAVVTLNKDGIIYFLDNTKYSISEWQQLKLLDVLNNKTDYNPPSFKVWLTSNNNHVVLFALRLIKHYNQNDAKASVIELVKHKSNQIREAAILCIKEFNFVEALDTLKLVFWQCSITVKISILETIAHLGSENDLEFLNLIETKEANFLVRNKAVSCINSISPETIMPFKDLQESKHFNIPKDISIAEDELKAGETELFNEISTYQDANIEIQNTIESKVQTENTNTEIALQTEKNETTEDFIDLNFLPIIVKTENEEEPNRIETPENIEALNISEIEVNYEIVAVETLDTKTEPKEVVHSNDINIKAIDITSLNFLPVVVINKAEISNEKEPFEIEVDYEVILPTSKSTYTAHELQNIEVDFSLFEINSEQDQPKEFSLEEIRNCEIFYDEVKTIEDSISIHVNDIEVIDALIIQNEPIIDENEDLGISICTSDSELESETDLNFSITPFGSHNQLHDAQLEKEDSTLVEFDLPKALIQENLLTNIDFDTETRFLLNNIDELGDEREIHFLNELRHDDKYRLFIDQIELLIKNLDNVSAKDKTKDILKPFNVFEDLFQHCDLESKLILLNEVYAIGDVKDIDFLKNLISVEKGDLQKTAIHVLNHLESKVHSNNTITEPQHSQKVNEIMNACEIECSNADDIYDLNFEPTDILESVVQEEVLTNSENNFFNSFLGQLNIFSSKNK